MTEENYSDKDPSPSDEMATPEENDKTNIEIPSILYSNSRIDLRPFQDTVDRVIAECGKVLIGQEKMIELIITCILTEGHILLEGVPGIAKTLTARVLAKTIQTDFSRIQFTPDLMPSDILGTSVFNLKESQFNFIRGPIFSNIVLIDEINRSPAKTQAALFEVMEEKQITFDGSTFDMSFPFIVIATQNPIEQEGTYRLPEAQLDRFLMKLILSYPNKEEEIQILNRHTDQIGKIDLSEIRGLLSPGQLREFQELIKEVIVENQMIEYITDIIQDTRTHSKIFLGGSPRASLSILRTAKITAMLAGRDFVTPDDIQKVGPHILNHRLILTPDAEMEGLSPFDIIEEIIQTKEVPR